MIYDEIAELFRERGYTLTGKNGETMYPDTKDIEELVDMALGELYTGGPGSMVIVGRMAILKNDTGTYDVFTWMGEVE